MKDLHVAPSLSRRHFLVLWGLVISCFTCSLQAAPDGFQVKDRVETNANGFGWIKGTVIEIGQGDQAGNVKVHADAYPQDFWVRATMASAIRKLAGETPEAAAAASAAAALDQAEATTPPRLGKYLIMSYGAGANPLHLGYIELMAGGKYRFLDMGSKTTGEGQYDYDGKKAAVRWITGPNLDSKWGGAFDITRAGKTHSIRCTRTTTAVNSTDAK
jgi:hypothetical protein